VRHLYLSIIIPDQPRQKDPLSAEPSTGSDTFEPPVEGGVQAEHERSARTRMNALENPARRG